MKLKVLKILLIVSIICLSINVLTAQSPFNLKYTNKDDTTTHFYGVLEPQGDIKAVLLLFSGGLSPSPQSFMEQHIFNLDSICYYNNILLMMPYSLGKSETHYLDDKTNALIDQQLSDLSKRFSLSRKELFLAGFSFGGTAAFRYGEYCAAGKSNHNLKLSGVIGVEPCLDLAEMWNFLQKAKSTVDKSIKNEVKRGIKLLSKTLGGSPEENYQKYLEASPLMTSKDQGGNAAYLKNIPVRLYVETDSDFIDNQYVIMTREFKISDVRNMKNTLQKIGNLEVGLITTSGKGYRRNGHRNPHSWSIVDEEKLIDWCLKK